MIKIIVLLLLTKLLQCQICYLPLSFSCNSTENLCPNATEIVARQKTVYKCPQTLELNAPVITLEGYFTALNLTAGSIQLFNLTIYSTLYMTASQTLLLTDQISVGGSIMIRSNIGYPSYKRGQPSEGIDIYEASMQITGSTIKCQKMTIIGMKNLTIQASYILTTYFLCLYDSLNVKTISENVTSFIQDNNVTAIDSLNFAVFIFVEDSADLENTVIKSVSIALLAVGDIWIDNSTLNASAQSCKSNTGMGRGTTIQYENTYCTSGSSSCGYGSISNPELCGDVVQYFMFLSHSFPYINKGPYLWTGSGGYGYTSIDSQSGSGGGIVFMLADQNITMNRTNILAAGGNVQNDNEYISAGSGGTIFITSQTLTGVSFNEISVAGGNCSNNNGSGGGGLVKITFEHILMHELYVNINEGNQGNSNANSIYSNGIFYGPTCPLGKQIYYLRCSSCSPGSYSSLGDPICLPCPPLSQLDLTKDQSGNSFIYQCYNLEETPQINQWLSPGVISLLSILLYFVFLVIFTLIGIFLKKKIKKDKLTAVEDFRIEDIKRDIEKAKILALQLRQSTTIKPHQLMYHVHRISCFGTNSEESPWVLPLTVPDEVQRYVHQKVFKTFAQNFNEEARWTKCEYYLAKLSCLLYPLYWYYLDKVKHRKFQKLLSKFQHAKDYNLLNNHDYEDRSILTIKFSKNKDYTNCYLDFFVYQRADTRYFTLSSPFLIHLSGQGNFLRPFYLEQEDLFFKMMFFVVNRNLKSELQGSQDEKSRLFSNMVSTKKRQSNSKQLIRFMRKLNTLACTLDLSAPNDKVVEVLWNLQELIYKWNRQFFNSTAVQVDLLFMISKLLDGSIIDTDVHLATHKNKEAFKSILLSKIEESSQYQHTLKIALFIYNPQQELPKEEEQDLSMIEYQNSLDVVDDSVRQTLMQSVRIPQKKTRIHHHSPGKVAKILSRLRYYIISHQNTHYDEYTIKFLQSLFILMQTMLVFIWSIKLQLPYVFVNLVCPLVGIIWFVSDSYGFGKLYLILAAMSLLNDLVALILYSTLQAFLISRDMAVRTVVCCTINISIVLLMLFIGRRAITQSKKLSLRKEDQPSKKD